MIGIGIAIGIAGGAALALLAVSVFGTTGVSKARRIRDQLLDDARRESDAVRREAQVEAREQAVRLRSEIDTELTDRRAQVLKIEERVLAKELEIEQKLEELSRRDQGLADREEHIRQLQDELKETKSLQLAELESVAALTQAEARALLLERGEEQARHELARRVRTLEDEARAESKRRARNLVADALQRGAATHAVVLSSFDGLRREVARLTVAKLLEDGRIHPARIEETYYESKAEVEEVVRQAGEQAVFEANCGPFAEELVEILGRLRFRTSYGQNVLKHTLEVVHLAGIMATELEASVQTAKRAAMLHDIGKAMSHEVEGSHALISAQLARRYGESQGVVHAIEAHHYEVQPQTVEAVLLIAADAVSASRPGARGESLEQYIKRLEALEELAASKRGVEKVYALQAGREIRVIVSPGDVGDDEAALLAHEIAREIEDRLEYPGQVKVTVIRESRAVEVAKNHAATTAHPPAHEQPKPAADSPIQAA